MPDFMVEFQISFQMRIAERDDLYVSQLLLETSNPWWIIGNRKGF